MHVHDGALHGIRAKLAEFFEIDLRSLAVFRIALGLLVLLDLALRLQDLHGHYTDGGVWPRELAAQELAKAKVTCFPLYFLGGSALFAGGMFAAAAVVALALIAGFWTRAATILSWLLLVSLHARLQPVLNGGDAIFALLFFWSMFLPLGARWSLDARRRRRQCRRSDPSDDSPPRAVLSVASAGLLLQMCLIYWFTAAFKWDPVWTVRGDAIRYALNIETYSTRFGTSLLAYPGLLRVLTFTTLWLEALGPCLAFVPVATGIFRTLAVVLFAGFHLVGIGTTMKLGIFPLICAAAWLVFLPRWFWDKILRRPAKANLRSGSNSGGNVATTVRRLHSHWIVNAMAGAALAFVVMANFASLHRKRFRPWFPGKLKPAMMLLRLNQHWAMFETLRMGAPGWQMAVAELRDGSVVDLLTGREIDAVTRPARLGDQFHSFRWGSYPGRERRTTNRERMKYYAAYLKRHWNSRQPPEREAAVVEIYFMIEVNAIPRRPPRPILLYSDAGAGTGMAETTAANESSTPAVPPAGSFQNRNDAAETGDADGEAGF